MAIVYPFPDNRPLEALTGPTEDELALIDAEDILDFDEDDYPWGNTEDYEFA